MRVVYDNGKPVVLVMDAKRRVRMGTRQAVGKKKAVNRMGSEPVSLKVS